MSINILLADDSITIQKVIGIIFGGEEYSLSIVDNGMAVLDKARQTVPDILLIDALMPGMSGYEVCERVRATPELAQKPILLLTGSFEPFDEEKAKTCGADDFIAKPFESQQIIAKVKELCELGAARSISQFQTPSQINEPFQSLATAPIAAGATNSGTAALDDIWGAFTNTVETTISQSPSSLTEADLLDTDVFAIVDEEPDLLLTPSEPPPVLRTAEPVTPQWTPVDENSFEFTEETVNEVPPLAFSEPSQEETSFGGISFESPEPEKSPFQQHPDSVMSNDLETVFLDTTPFAENVIPDSEESTPVPPSFEPEPDVAHTDNISAIADHVAPAPATAVPLTEEQIKAAIAGLSKDVIERIVWEVVPDLAENIIMEAIRKIREGR